MFPIVRIVLSLLFLIPLLSAHPQPTTLMTLDIGSATVDAQIHVPLSELEHAFGHRVTEQPLTEWSDDFRQYLNRHLHPATVSGQRWKVKIGDMKLEQAEQSFTGRFQEVLVDLQLSPPAGASVREFVLHYDGILHQVVTHKVLISVRRDWTAGQVDQDPVQVGHIFVDTRTGRIEPLTIRLDEGSSWIGFKAMVALGMRHIREGTDHLLFLLVLLLPLPYSASRIIRIVTAFTLGHSLTLLAGALNWLRLPQQPVEVLIAFSILVTAVHAIRPIFPGKEAHVAAGFGLIHGLAFATVLSDLQLPAGQLSLSILGFNLGIEIMQLFAVALILPWLVLLASTPSHKWVRLAGATAAMIASCGWMLNRVTGQPNTIERWLGAAPDLAPFAIFLLAGIAIPAYFYTTFWKGTAA